MRKRPTFNIFTRHHGSEPEPCVFCGTPVSVYAPRCPECGEKLFGWGPDTPPMRDTDMWQSPPEVIDPLLPFIPPGRVWEPCCGSGNLVRALREAGREAVGTDIIRGFDFFDAHPLRGGKRPTERAEVIVTNPPWKKSTEYIALCFALRRPWALLLPVDNLGGAGRVEMFRRRGVEVIVFDRRPRFRHPDGRGSDSPDKNVAWFTWGFNLPAPLMFAEWGQGETILSPAAGGGPVRMGTARPPSV